MVLKLADQGQAVFPGTETALLADMNQIGPERNMVGDVIIAANPDKPVLEG
jgi:hypothetical protein